MSDRALSVLQIVENLEKKDVMGNYTFDRSLVTQHQRILVSDYLYNIQNYTQAKIARLFGVATSRICEDLKRVAGQQLQAIKVPQVEEVIRNFIQIKNRMVEKARRKDDIKLEWQIECDFLDRLGKIGVIPYQLDNQFFVALYNTKNETKNIILESKDTEKIKSAIAESVAEVQRLSDRLKNERLIT